MRRWEAVVQGHKVALERAVAGAPTDEVLKSLVSAARGLTEDGLGAAIFIAEPEKAYLRFAAAAGLPESYTRAVDNFAIGPNQPSCGKAAYTGEAVIVHDVAKDEHWKPYLKLAHDHGIRACWSFPLHSARGELLGTFALYHRSPRDPDSNDFAEAKYFATIAALVLQQHKAAEERAESQRHAVQQFKNAEKSKDDFLSVVVHEMRNPLAVLASGMQLARLAIHNPETVERSLSMMERQTQHLTRIVEDLLDVQGIAQGKIQLRKAPMQLQAALNLAFNATSHQISLKNQSLVLEIPAEPIVLEADATRITQIVNNLIANASKYSAPDTAIHVKVARTSKGVNVTVKDHGTGIDSDQLKRIFDLYHQVNPTGDTQQGGLGIGLNLANQFALLHGGTLHAHSAGLGMGSEFILHLPLART